MAFVYVACVGRDVSSQRPMLREYADSDMLPIRLGPLSHFRYLSCHQHPGMARLRGHLQRSFKYSLNINIFGCVCIVQNVLILGAFFWHLISFSFYFCSLLLLFHLSSMLDTLSPLHGSVFVCPTPPCLVKYKL